MGADWTTPIISYLKKWNTSRRPQSFPKVKGASVVLCVNWRYSLQKRFLLPISKMPSPQWSWLHYERIPWRSMWEPFGGAVTSSQAHTSRILLVHHTKGHPILCKSVWQVPTIYQHYMAIVGKTYSNERPVALRLMRTRHYEALPYSDTVTQVPYRGSWLLHQMGWSGTFSHHH